MAVRTKRKLEPATELRYLETELLLETIFLRYGYDFRKYHRSSIKKRLEQYCLESGINNISELIPEILHNGKSFNRLLLNMSVTVTEMFREPRLFRLLREKMIPILKTYPFINVWLAGCATGEEAYSVAITFEEEAILRRTRIYATDINAYSLETAQKGYYSLQEMKQYTANYNQAGGKGVFADYYGIRYGRGKIDDRLKEHITFSQHNLVTDGVFSETHLIICQNVLIYFERELQDRVLELFTDSLCYHGFLCLGSNESIEFSSVCDKYEIIDKEAKVYRKKVL